uniref:Polymerase PB2 n=1 Tax=Coleopteran orthomyxo-related virus OKIAV184 TaxID=2746264 RepID=A0A7D7IKC2_9ORTO|nr:polymerase PB2 [Coleopteran orthomyxo-related virus OKIAV184]
MPDKETILKAVRHINKMKQGSVEILRKMQMLNMKLMERASKCTKDPNPLASTMTLMNKKYPLSIDRELSKKYKVPSRFLQNAKCESSRWEEDMHISGRILCKKEAVDWWIEEAVLPNEDTKRVVQILYESHEKAVELFFSINWRLCRIKWGKPVLERRMVKTRIPLLAIPKHLREDVIKEALFPEYTLPNRMLTNETLEKVKELINVSISSRMLLSRQIRIVLNSLDPSERVLPMLPNSSDDTVPLKHALCHTNYVITNYKIESRQQAQDMYTPLEIFINSLVFEGKLAKMSAGDVKEIADNTYILGNSIQVILIEKDLPKTIQTKWIRTLYNLQCDLEYTFGELTVSPEPSQSGVLTHTNLSGVIKDVREKQETIHYKMGALRGNFTHLCTSLITVTSNYTEPKAIKHLLAEIAAYIGWGWVRTTGKNQKEAENEIRVNVIREPWKVIGGDRRAFAKIGTDEDEEWKCGNYTIRKDTEYFKSSLYQLEITDDMNIKNPHTDQIIEIRVPRTNLRTFSEEIQCEDTRMLNHFSFKKTIRNRTHYYSLNFTELIRKIKEGDFIWKNVYFRKFMGANSRSVSQLARYSLSNMVHGDVYNEAVIILLYCFANPDPMATSMSPPKFFTKTGHCVDIDALEGIFTYNDRKERYELFGTKMTDKSTRLNRASILEGAIYGYRLSSIVDPTKPLMSYKSLDVNYSRIPNGSTYRTYICGAPYMATKDTLMKNQVKRTMNRQMKEWIDSLSSKGDILFGKRNNLDLDDSDDEVDAKKAKLDDLFCDDFSDEDNFFGDEMIESSD